MTLAKHLSDDMLNAWLDHDLPDTERAAVEAHLPQCAACRREAETLAALKAALASLPQVDPPRSFRLTPDQARQARPGPAAVRPTLRLLPIVRSLSIAAVVALLVVSSALLLGPVSEDDASTATMGVTMETSRSSNASLEQEAEAAGGAPEEIVDQGEAAPADADALPRAAAPQPAPATGADSEAAGSDDDALSPLQITAIALGAVTVVLLGLWLALARMGPASPVR